MHEQISYSLYVYTYKVDQQDTCCSWYIYIYWHHTHYHVSVITVLKIVLHPNNMWSALVLWWWLSVNDLLTKCAEHGLQSDGPLFRSFSLTCCFFSISVSLAHMHSLLHLHTQIQPLHHSYMLFDFAEIILLNLSQF